MPVPSPPEFWKLDTRVTAPMTAALRPFVRVLRGNGLGALAGIARTAGIRQALRAVARAIARREEGRLFVEGNLYRKAIRLPHIFTGPILAAYGAVKRVEAVLVHEYLDLALPHDSGIAVIFNGSNFPESVLADVSARHGMKRVFTEAGFLPGTLQIDSKGLNAANSVPREPEFYLDTQTDFTEAGLPDDIGRRAAKRGGPRETSLPDRFVFAPFQVPSDMQVRVHSPWITSMEAFLEVLGDLADAHPDRTFVIKEHPSFRRPVDRSRIRSERLVFANHTDTAELIGKADAVLTLNSTVGFEALVLDRPVIVLGDACYDIDGLVLRARSAAEASDAIGRLSNWHPDPALRRQFLGYIRNVYLAPGTFRDPHADLAEFIRARAAESPND